MLKFNFLLLSFAFVNFTYANNDKCEYDDDYAKYQEKLVMELYKPGCEIVSPFAMPDIYRKIRLDFLQPIGSPLRTRANCGSPTTVVFSLLDVLEVYRKSSCNSSSSNNY